MIAWVPLVIAVALAAASPRHAWRWLTGLPLDGPKGRPRYRTDATWNRPGTRLLHPIPVVRWHWWRRRRRAGIRSGATLAAALLAWSLAVNRTAALAQLAVLTAAGIALIARPARRRVTGWQHHRTYELPAAASYRDAVGAPPVRLAIAQDRSAVDIDVHPDFSGSPGDIAAIDRVVAVKVRPGLVADWSGLAGRQPRAHYREPDQPPPPKVALADIRAHVDACGPDALVAGLGSRRAPVLVSLQDDSPHLALSIGSGGGKTTGAKWLAVQVLYKGGLLVVLNKKRLGYAWTRGLPNAAQAKEYEDIGTMLLWLDGERMRREAVADDSVDIEDEIHADVGPRIMVVFEEQNLTVPPLKKIMPEAVEALGNLGYAGRQSRIHLMPIAQRYSAKAAGGGDLRATVGTRLLGRYDKDAWNMLAKAFAMPPMNNTPGRVQVVTSDVEECQMPRLTGREAHDYALAGRVAVCPAATEYYPAMPFQCATMLPVTGRTALNPGPDHGSVTGSVPAGPDPYEDQVTLREAVEDAGLWPSLAAARKASTRPGFPDPAGVRDLANLYDLGELKVRTGR